MQILLWHQLDLLSLQHMLLTIHKGSNLLSPIPGNHPIQAVLLLSLPFGESHCRDASFRWQLAPPNHTVCVQMYQNADSPGLSVTALLGHSQSNISWSSSELLPVKSICMELFVSLCSNHPHAGSVSFPHLSSQCNNMTYQTLLRMR